MSQEGPLPVYGHGVGPLVLMVNLGLWVCGLKAEVAA